MKRLTVILAAFSIGVASLAAAPGAPIGAEAAAGDPAPSLESMLRYAIEDEYLARAEYEAIIGKYGLIRPFSNIMEAEEQHIAFLRAAYAEASLAPPADGSRGRVVVPASLPAAYAAGVDAEVANIAMYDKFLASAILAKAENASLKALFTKLRDASRKHLEAFKRQAGRR